MTKIKKDSKNNIFSFPLKLNSGGDKVKALQIFLNDEGSYGLDADGKFGPLTLEAVKNQQSPFSDFKMSFPNAVLGEVSEEYYNSFVLRLRVCKHQFVHNM